MMRAAWRRVALCAVMGIVCGAACVLLGVAFDLSYEWSRVHEGLIWALPLVGVCELVLYRAVGIPESTGSQDVALAAREGLDVPLTLAAAVFTATCASVAFGASVGKEAVAVQMCAALSLALAQLAGWLFRGRVDTSLALMCGMAAGIGALLHAPVAGVLMAFETARCAGWDVRRSAAVGASAFAAAVLAYVTACLAGGGPFASVPFSAASLFADAMHAAASAGAETAAAWSTVLSSGALEALAVIAIAVACAGAGLVYGVVLRWLRGSVRHMRLMTGSANVAPYVAVALGGLLAAALTEGFDLRAFTGSGFDLLPGAFAGQVEAWAPLAKIALTLLVLGVGFKGGEIMPALVTGALLGSVLAVGAHMGASAVAASALLGMLAFFGASSRCPLAACALGVELLVLP